MAEEQNKNLSNLASASRLRTGKQEMVKKVQQATLGMAKDWGESQDTIHHAIKSYDDVIRIDPDSPEADQARAGLLKIAEDWDKKGQKYAAARLYKELITYKNN